jgi:hypothetical protein
MNVKPTKQKDGTETVTLYGTTVDVTGKDSFTLFKRDYTVVRQTKNSKPKAKKMESKDQ